MGIHNVRHHARALPDEPLQMIAAALQALPVPSDQVTNYLTTLLMSIHGWASWCAYERWQARLTQSDDNHIIQLLAIRLAWEHFEYLHLFDSKALTEWEEAWKLHREYQQLNQQETSVDWIFQEAMEVAFQTELCHSLKGTLESSDDHTAKEPKLQSFLINEVQ
jgi:uncharacterized protein YbcC (UPF0753/DUF2309 family)